MAKNKKQKVKSFKISKNIKKTSKTNPFLVFIPLLLTAIVFGNSLQNEFVNWDDPVNFLRNPWIVNSGELGIWKTLIGIFSSDVIGNYNPLSTASYLLDKNLFGFEQPMGWHLINVLLHLGVVFLVFQIGRLLGLNPIASVLLATLFGIHPMRVESVSWITERKDVLFGLFYFLSIFYYLKNIESRKTKNLVLLYLFFILSLFSKIQAVSLPLSLMAIDYWQGRGFTWKGIISKGPMWILSLVFGIIGIIVLKNHGSIVETESSPLWHGIFFASMGLMTYLYKLLIPVPLSNYYPSPESFGVIHYISLVTIPLLFFILWKAYRKQKKVWFFGTSFFLVNIVFVLQLVRAGQGYLADRFSYIAYFGLFFILAYYFQQFVQTSKWKNVSIGLSIVFILVMSFLSIQQNQVWKNGESLWTHAISIHPDRIKAYGARGNYYFRQKKYKQAYDDYTNGISIKENADLYANRGKTIFYSGQEMTQKQLALQDYNKAIELEPTRAEFYFFRGGIKAQIDSPQNTIEDFNKGIALDANVAEAFFNRGKLHYSIGQNELALKDYASAIELEPRNFNYLFGKGQLERMLNKNSEAINNLNLALSINSSNCNAYYERSLAHYANGNVKQAKSDLSKAIQLGCQVDQAYRTSLGL